MLKQQDLNGKKSEYAFEEGRQKPTAVASQYAVTGLENVVTMETNPLYQREPLPAKNRHLVPGSGIPVSSAVLKEKIANLEDKIYQPVLLDGQLFFVSTDDDTRTAQETDPPEPMFTLSQLRKILGQETLNKLTGMVVEVPISTRTAAYRTVVTGEEKTESAVTALSDGLLTARGSESEMVLASFSTTGIPDSLTLNKTDVSDMTAARTVPSVDTITAVESK